MRFGHYRFRPGLWPTLATLALLPLLVGLGVWQLQRAEWKQGLIDANAARAALAPVELATLQPFAPDDQYRRVVISGHYDLDHQLLLDNRMWQGHPGYEVLTPLQPVAGGAAVLVNRGWVPASPDRSVLPALPGSTAEVRVHATIKLPPEKIFRLSDAEEEQTGWPRVVQQPELAHCASLLGYPLQPVFLLLDSADAHGFRRDWQPVYGVTPDKHRAYALQWLTLALVLAAIYIGVNTRRIDKDGTDGNETAS
ncbi:MAG: SURF1 family protein [Pseudomonadota bacterium]